MLPTNRASSIGEQVMRKTRGSDRPRQRIASRSANRAITPPAAVIDSQSRWKTVLGSGAISFSAAANSGGVGESRVAEAPGAWVRCAVESVLLGKKLAGVVHVAALSADVAGGVVNIRVLTDLGPPNRREGPGGRKLR